MKHLHALSWVCLVVVVSLACAQVAPKQPAASVEEQALFDQARARSASDPVETRVLLRSFLSRYPESPLADDAALELAQVADRLGDPVESVRWLKLLLRDYPDSDRSDAGRVALARHRLAEGNRREAQRLLGEVRLPRLEPSEQREAIRLLADSTDDAVDRLYWLAALRDADVAAEDASALAGVDIAIDRQLDGLTIDELEAAVDRVGRRIPSARLHMRLAARALDAGDFETAERQLARAQRLPIVEEYEDEREQLTLRIELRQRIQAESDGLPTFSEVAALPEPRTDGAHGALGVVLPLTGPFAEYGAKSLKGILLAARIYDESAAPLADDVDAPREPSVSGDGEEVADAGLLPIENEPALRILIRDSQGDPALAAAAVAELAENEDVRAIVGPLLSAECEAAAAAAEEARIPLLVLSSREEVAGERPYVFRLRTTPADEVRFLVDHAFEKLGARRFAILYPADSYGRGMRDRFWKAVDERDGAVVAVSRYDVDATDFAEPIRRMIGYPLLTNAEKEALVERDEVLQRARRLPPEDAAIARTEAYELVGPEGDPLPPLVDFDALFIPDSHENVVLIAPQLAFHEITGVRLLGPGAWDHPDLVRIARKHVRGAVISTPFHAESRFVFVSRFVERYSTTFGGTPDLYAAQAFDASNLVLVQLASGQDTRKQVREGVSRVQGYPGVSGVTSVGADGNARKRPYLLGVRGSNIISLD